MGEAEAGLRQGAGGGGPGGREEGTRQKEPTCSCQCASGPCCGAGSLESTSRTPVSTEPVEAWAEQQVASGQCPPAPPPLPHVWGRPAHTGPWEAVRS